MIELINCEKSYGKKNVFKNISYRFNAHTYWIKGINGIGKSVLLRCMIGLENFTNGKQTGDIGKVLYLPDTTLGDSWLTLDENIKLMFYYYGIPIDSVKFDDIKRILGITDGQVLTSQVSLGTSLKIGLSLLFVENHWNTIVLDETLSHVDDNTKILVLTELYKRTNEGCTIFVTNHGELPTSSLDINIEELFLLEDKLYEARSYENTLY